MYRLQLECQACTGKAGKQMLGGEYSGQDSFPRSTWECLPAYLP
ncbi:hypothetical protein [Oceanospirillum maris]|nr:hypothetical protein [Oceanospirillum maris]